MLLQAAVLEQQLRDLEELKARATASARGGLLDNMSDVNKRNKVGGSRGTRWVSAAED